MKQSSLRLRPKTFASVVGQEKVLGLLTKLWAKKNFPNGLFFHGPSGVGKTTVARIVALSLQCKHQKGIGNPCKECRRRVKEFPIFEMNASKETGKDAVADFIKGSDFDPLDENNVKVYILDELHKFSDSAQNLLLKYLEKDESNVIWILCTTRPDAVVDTLRQRCRSFKFSGLKLEEVKTLVTNTLARLKSDLGAEPLIDELYENRITSGRLIVNAVDNYIAGLPPDEAVFVDIEAEVKTKHLCRAVAKGAWADTAKILKQASRSEVKLLRAGVIGYLLEVLLNDADVNDRTTGVAKAIHKLTIPHAFDNHSQFAEFSATLYELCKIFSARSL